MQLLDRTMKRTMLSVALRCNYENCRKVANHNITLCFKLDTHQYIATLLLCDIHTAVFADDADKDSKEDV